VLTVSRKVIEVNPRFQPDGKRFAVKEYPKDKEYRRLKISAQLVQKIEAHVRSEGLGTGDLMFARRARRPSTGPLRVVADPGTLGMTEPNEKGRQYRHAQRLHSGKCRCEHCEAPSPPIAPGGAPRAVHFPAPRVPPRTTITFRATGSAAASGRRRAKQPTSDSTREPTIFGTPRPLAYQLRRWRRPPGRQGRLSHASILTTTQQYFHTLPDTDETALDALARIRSRVRQEPT